MRAIVHSGSWNGSQSLVVKHSWSKIRKRCPGGLASCWSQILKRPFHEGKEGPGGPEAGGHKPVCAHAPPPTHACTRTCTSTDLKAPRAGGGGVEWEPHKRSGGARWEGTTRQKTKSVCFLLCWAAGCPGVWRSAACVTRTWPVLELGQPAGRGGGAGVPSPRAPARTPLAVERTPLSSEVRQFSFDFWKAAVAWKEHVTVAKSPDSKFSGTYSVTSGTAWLCLSFLIGHVAFKKYFPGLFCGAPRRNQDDGDMFLNAYVLLKTTLWSLSRRVFLWVYFCPFCLEVHEVGDPPLGAGLPGACALEPRAEAALSLVLRNTWPPVRTSCAHPQGCSSNSSRARLRHTLSRGTSEVRFFPERIFKR